jgi:1,2-diacylglycerol 3-alpha-glucosyltransferase
VLVVAPQFPGAPDREEGVIRVPAVQKFGGSDFSVPLPLSRPLSEDIEAFRPDIVHSHHPFLLGDTALRVSAWRNIPAIFTYHTRYELYGHYVAQDSEILKRLVLSLSMGYCDLCDGVIAPSASIAEHLRDHGVATPLTIIPTGIDVAAFAAGNGERSRKALAIPPGTFVVGHVGRLAPEKNLVYLTEALIRFLKVTPKAMAAITGDGSLKQAMADMFAQAGLSERVRFTGVKSGSELCDAYAAMDVFAFASHSETQGLVLAEAMAAGVPVAALDAPGVREVVRDGSNGILLPQEAPQEALAAALTRIAEQGPAPTEHMRKQARVTATHFAADRCIGRTLDLYRKVIGNASRQRIVDDSVWQSARRSLAREIDIFGNMARAVGNAVGVTPSADTKVPTSP